MSRVVGAKAAGYWRTQRVISDRLDEYRLWIGRVGLEVVNFATDYANVSNGGQWSVGVEATKRLTALVKDSGKRREVWSEDTGHDTMDNSPSCGKVTVNSRKENFGRRQ